MTDLLQGGAPAVGPLPRVGRRPWLLRGIPLGRAPGHLLPLSQEWLDDRLARALAEATRTGAGFYLGSLTARHALAHALLINVEPTSIERRLRHRLGGADGARIIRDRFIGAGEWEALLSRLDESSTYREVREVVQADLDYRKTEAFEWALQRARDGRPVRRNFVPLKTPELVESYFHSIVDLTRSILEAGVVHRAQYRRLSHLFGNCRVRPPWVEAVESDIGIAIGARGEVYRFASGKHRMAIAQVLGLARIPVEVRMVHADWLRREVELSGLRPVSALRHALQRLDRGAGSFRGGSPEL